MPPAINGQRVWDYVAPMARSDVADAHAAAPQSAATLAGRRGHSRLHPHRDRTALLTAWPEAPTAGPPAALVVSPRPNSHAPPPPPHPGPGRRRDGRRGGRARRGDHRHRRASSGAAPTGGVPTHGRAAYIPARRHEATAGISGRQLPGRRRRRDSGTWESSPVTIR